MDTASKKTVALSPEDLGRLGGGHWAYIREIGRDDAIRLIGPDTQIAPEMKLYCLYDAAGQPVSISGSREDAVGSAFEHELMPMSVH
jgi:hypothetical protein